nr:integrase, catalytic region, zinc finger, CCHC-type, peptidase aspartic, catalytic [Tanacetum cinerariifolium]
MICVRVYEMRQHRRVFIGSSKTKYDHNGIGGNTNHENLGLGNLHIGWNWLPDVHTSAPIKVEKDFVLEKLKSLIRGFVEEDSSSTYVWDSLGGLREIHGCGHADRFTDNHRIYFLESFSTKFVRDIKYLAKEADESLAKHKALEMEIERLLREIVSQDIISIVQNNSVVDTSNLQTELERVDNTAKTRRPHPRSNTKNDMVPSVSKSSCNKNKEVEVEEHRRNLLLYKNKKHMSSEYNNVKLASRNDKSVVVCAIFTNWKAFDLKGKIITYSESESQSDCSKGDNACTSKPSEPTIKRFPNSTFFMVGTVRFRNDHAVVILGFSDLQWGNILITKVEAIATACYTQNRSIIHCRFNKTTCELINGRKPDISFLHVFGDLCYPKNDREDTGKLGTKGDIGIFISNSVDSCAYRVYN